MCDTKCWKDSTEIIWNDLKVVLGVEASCWTLYTKHYHFDSEQQNPQHLFYLNILDQSIEILVKLMTNNRQTHTVSSLSYMYMMAA